MEDITHRHRRFLAYCQGFAIGLAILAFFSQPLMRFAHPGALCLSGLMIAVGVAAIYLQFAVRWGGVAIGILGPGIVVGGFFALGVCAVQAYQVSRINDEACSKIEADMLLVRPKMTDGPARFQAFMCRPTRGSIVIR